MITPKIKALFRFIDYLHSNIENFKQYDEVTNELHLLDKERKQVSPRKMVNKFMKIPGRLVLKYSFILNVVILLYSCENLDNKSSNNYKIKNTNLELSKESIDQFNRIFEGFYFNDIYQQFNSGYLILHPKLNEKYINYSDTAHFVFFALEGDSIEDLIITVNKKGCFASIVYNLDGYLYPNQSVIFPGDYSFLNKDQLPVNFDCINQDSLSLREVAFDANMLGVWYVDSISSIRRNFNQSFDIKNITIV